MNERNLVICDREIRYADILGENISMREDLAVKVYVCSNVEKVLELSEDVPIHLLVVDEGYSYEERKQIAASQVFVLGRGKVTDLGDEECQVGKYQCAEEIIREIFEAYIDKTKENVMRNKKKHVAKLVAVYSPIHRVGKTTFAIELGKECAKKRRVLYLNMEEYAAFEETAPGGLNLGDLLYYIKQRNGNLGVRLQSAIKKIEELDVVSAIPISQDLKEIPQKEWEMLLEELLTNTIYEMVIMDVSESMQGLMHILESCDKVYMPVLEDEISLRKIQQYDKNIEQLNLEKLKRITHRFVMPEDVKRYAKIRAKEEI